MKSRIRFFVILLAVGFAFANISIFAQNQNTVYTPYVDVCLWPPFDIGNVDSTGVCLYTCAFIVDDQFEEGVNPCWGGYATLDMTWYQDKIAQVRDQGGDVIISFGGASGFPLAYVASDEFELKEVYKLVIDSYNLQSVDFDVEGMFIAHPDSYDRRAKAMKLLQEDYPDLQMSLTLPVMPFGLTLDGINVVTNAVENGIDLSIVNIMAMDYGGPGDMGDMAISAMENTFSQLKSIYLENGLPKPDSVIWAMIGITPMIGQNDVMEEVFYLDDAEDVRDFAFEKKVGRISMWSVNRDRQCENSWDPLYICSHIEQTDFEFSYIFQQNGALSYCDLPTSVSQAAVLQAAKVYPNPAGDYIVVSECEGAELTIKSLEGVTLIDRKALYPNQVLDISGLKNGTYLAIVNLNDTMYFQKIVVLR